MAVEPSPEELAAIIAAVEMTWPRPVLVTPALEPEGPSPWRFAGRWWSGQSVVRRTRPWIERPS
jgi:hypothetical protein